MVGKVCGIVVSTCVFNGCVFPNTLLTFMPETD